MYIPHLSTLVLPFVQYLLPSSPHSAMTPAHDRDLATFSNYQSVRTSHLHLDWSIDWASQTIGGSVLHDLVVLDAEGVDQVILDTRDLNITKVVTDKGNELKVLCSACLRSASHLS